MFSRLLIGLSAALLLPGLLMPMLTLSKFYVMGHSFSVVGGIVDLFRGGHVLLAIAVLFFSVLVPVAKLVLMLRLSAKKIDDSASLERILHVVHDYGRWAMLDVLVVAVLFVTVKLGALASVQIHAGLYVFGAAVLMIMLATHHTVALVAKRSGQLAAK